MGLATIGILGIGVLIVLILLGVHVGIAMTVVGFTGLVMISGLDAGLGMIKLVPYSTIANYSMIVIPLFVFMGQVAFHSGLSKDLFDAAYKWLGRLPGGLAMSTVAACACFGAISGSSPATAATIGTVALPAMKKYKYDVSLATASIASAGTLGILIPPSVALILYGIVTTQSIGKLLIAGILPGILLTLMLMLTIFILVKRNPALGPPGPSTGLKEKIIAFLSIKDMIILFLVVIGGMFIGLFTVNEAAAVGAFGAIIVSAFRGKLNLKMLSQCLLQTGRITAMIFLIMIGAMVLGYFLAVTQLPANLSEFLSNSSMPRHVTLAGIVVIYIFLGCIMDSLAMILLTVPIFYPVILNLGFDPIWFGIIMVLVMEQGLITPPVGLNCYIIAGIDKTIPLHTIFKGVFPFWLAIIITVIILTIFPQIATFLPNLLK